MMEFYLFSIFFVSTALINYPTKKLVNIMSLEIMMMMVILMYSASFLGSMVNSMILFILSMFMVLDSVFSISCLLMSTRNSTFYSQDLNKMF